jgi:voltage-gated potassium channel
MSIKSKIKCIVEDSDTKFGRIFDLIIQFFVLISLIGFSLETLPNLEPEQRSYLRWIEIAVVGLFTVEYALRFWVADTKLRFVFSFYGLIDLLAILPFYIAMGVDLRSVRILRLFRVLRVFKLTRYSDAMQNLGHAFVEVKQEMILFFMMTVIMIYMSAVGIYYFENPEQPEEFSSIFECLWWAVATLTTVGYGDVYPVTAGGRLFTFVILMVGLGIVAVPTGLISSALTRKRG